MHKVIIDPALLGKLRNSDETLELCDQSGRTLGYYTPVTDPSLYKGVEPPITEEELQQREKETKRYTTAEVLEHLEKL